MHPDHFDILGHRFLRAVDVKIGDGHPAGQLGFKLGPAGTTLVTVSLVGGPAASTLTVAIVGLVVKIKPCRIVTNDLPLSRKIDK